MGHHNTLAYTSNVVVYYEENGDRISWAYFNLTHRGPVTQYGGDSILC